MNFISKLLHQLFGRREQAMEPPPPVRSSFMEMYEKQRLERIMNAEASLKDWLIRSLRQSGTMPFHWESGNDEAFVTFENKTGTDEESYEELEQYIVDKLNIPDAGEFQMNGMGEIYLSDQTAKVKYSSTLKAIIDFDETTNEEIYSEEERDSGDLVLFPI